MIIASDVEPYEPSDRIQKKDEEGERALSTTTNVVVGVGRMQVE